MEKIPENEGADEINCQLNSVKSHHNFPRTARIAGTS